MKIFVTGGSGFIGSNFIHFQINQKNKIFNFDKLTYSSSIESLSSLQNNPYYMFKKGDISIASNLEDAVKFFKPNIIINFAAETHVDRSIDGPKDFIQTNIFGTYNLLQVSLNYYKSLNLKEKKRFKLIHISTDEVFGTLDDKGFFNENTPYDPSSPYSASKASSDHLVRAWNKTYDLPVIITNCSNNYGPYQFPEKLIPLMIINAMEKKKLPIYGKGNNIRDWLHVFDHCRAIDIIMQNGKLGSSYIIGGNCEKTNLDIVNMICDIFDKKFKSNNFKHKNLINFVDDRPGHDYRYAVDYSKIKNELKWEPEISFKKGLASTIDWYLNNDSWWKKIQQTKYNQKRLGLLK
ncbi:MAG: dTDP-glucose 4,6-dehydratase [Candidatus Marinimicrobia bacterium]|nr:dTDP-glucose 4,6-dehydratase [Candidatus Neomarinimicrobiota bacterium]